MDLTIIIVNWNTKRLLETCLKTVADNLAELPSLKSETIVVDNASNDGSVDMVRTNFSWVRLVDNSENVGFAKANNQAFEMSSGRFVLLLNPDTELRNGALAALTGYMDENAATGIAGARLLNSDGTLQQSCYRFPTPGRELWLLLHLDKLYPDFATYDMSEWDTQAPRKVEVLKGACLILRRDLIVGEQLFDEAYFMYSEEVDLCRRIHKAGWGIDWVPQGEVVHHEGQSTKQAIGVMFFQLYRAKLLYFRKHGGRWTARYYKVALFIAALIRLIISPLAWLERPENRQHHLALTNRYWSLLRTLPSL